MDLSKVGTAYFDGKKSRVLNKMGKNVFGNKTTRTLRNKPIQWRLVICKLKFVNILVKLTVSENVY